MGKTALQAGLAAGCLVIAFGTGFGPHGLAQDAKPPSSDQAPPSIPAPTPAPTNAPDFNAAAPPPPAESAAPSSPPAQPAAPPEKPPEAAAPAAPPPSKSVLDKRFILGVLGKDVKSAKGEDMGRIVDVIVDWSGQTRAAIIDFGGFLGVGSRRIAVDWRALHFEPQQKGDQITLDLTRDQVKAAPEYKEDKPVVVLGPSGTAEPIPYD
ncbi:MAG TPA: PRC-barrel domain-containing protein [Alphaproteobacteria bacterium]|nr:PRC-barrel domain-containing protein [Alphaproteobacteria bacterium]